jgi:hypothetical protein
MHEFGMRRVSQRVSAQLHWPSSSQLCLLVIHESQSSALTARASPAAALIPPCYQQAALIPDANNIIRFFCISPFPRHNWHSSPNYKKAAAPTACMQIGARVLHRRRSAISTAEALFIIGTRAFACTGDGCWGVRSINSPLGSRVARRPTRLTRAQPTSHSLTRSLSPLRDTLWGAATNIRTTCRTFSDLVQAKRGSAH